MGKQKVNKKLDLYNFNLDKINLVFFLLLAVFITLPLIFRGGYFEDEMIPILIGFNMVFILYIFIQTKNKDFKIINTPIEIFFLGITIMYLISMFYGVSKRGSLVEFAKYFSYFGFIVISFNLSKDKRLQTGVLDTIIIGSIIVSLIGIGVMSGLWDYNGAVAGNRLNSTFQYPNTLAAYVSGIYILSLTLLSNEEKRLKKILYGFGAGSCLFTLILTYSRAMWLMFPLFLLIYFILIPNSRKLETLLYIICSAVISLPAAFIITRMTESNSKILLIYLVATIVTGILEFIISLLDKKFRNFSIKILFGILGLLLIIVCALGFFLINSTTEITLSNNTEENKWSLLNRNVTKTTPNMDYTLEVAYNGENKSDSPYLGRVIIYNLDENGGTTQLHVENIKESSQEKIVIPFTTPENSIGVRIRFDNYYMGTSFTVIESSIIELNNENNKINIPLKYKYIPESIVSRFNSITTGETSFIRRIRFNIDGLGIIKDHLILGTGAEGWRTLYEQYKSEPYTSNQAHNYFLQLWIEIGLIGFILLITMLTILTIATFKTYRKQEDIYSKTIIIGLYTTILTMLGHAFVDFDMSLSGYAIIIWVCLGLLICHLDFSDFKIDKKVSIVYEKSKLVNFCVAISSIFLIFVLSFTVLAKYYAVKAVEANESNDIGLVAFNFEKAVRFDGLEPSYKIDLANTYKGLYNMTEDTEYLRKALEQVERYVKLAPKNIETNVNASSFYLSIGQIEKGLEFLDRSVEMEPLRVHSYINKLKGYFAVFDYYFFKGEDDLALDALKEGLRIKEQIAEANQRSIKPIEEDIELVYNFGESKFYLENFNNLYEVENRGLKLDFAYYFEDLNSDEKIDILDISKPSGSNIGYEKLGEEGFEYIRITNDGEKSGFIYPKGINLLPDTKYVVDIKARGTVNPGTFRVYAWSSSSEDPNQGGIDDIPLTDDWHIYTFEFMTDSDVEPGKQYIRLQHDGNDKGYIDIEEVIIYQVRE